MHLYLWIRGNPYHCALWRDMLQVQFWQWSRINQKDKTLTKTLIQGNLRPTIWGAYEYIIPEDCLAECLAVIGFNGGTPAYSLRGQLGQLKGELKMKVIRKFFGASPIPKEIFKEAAKIPRSVYLEGSKRGLHWLDVPGVAVHVIGIKKDEYGIMYKRVNPETGVEEDFPEGYYQEMV